MIILEVVLGYFLIVFVVLRIIVPNLGFSRAPIPDVLPPTLKAKIDEMNSNSSSDLEFLQKAYTYVTQRYVGGRVNTFLKFWRAFGRVPIKDPGFLPCTGQNYFLRTLLIKSGRFSEDDIEIHTVPLNLFIHQYLRVKAAGQWMDVDPWSNFLGVPLGQKKAFFG